MTTRASIAAALTGSGLGVKGCPKRPTVFEPFLGWGQPASHEYAAAAQTFLTTWSVYVVLPTDEQAAADWFDTNIDALRNCLQPEMFVQRDEPVTLGLDPNAFAVLITGTSE